jgi:PPOX class probable F420-dependent enzyme
VRLRSTHSDATHGPFAPLLISSVALLTTFRRNGEGVATPVGIRVRAERAYFTTWSTTGKVKRLARNPHVLLAPSTRLGRPRGPTVEGLACRLEPTEAAKVTDTLFNTSLWGRLWDWMYRLRGRQAIMYEVVPASNPAASGGGAAEELTQQVATSGTHESNGGQP